MGTLYKKIIESDEGAKLYGKIPLMASSSPYQIGALNAESFCERVLRCAGHVMTEGNTLLGNEKLEKLGVLRMNRGFMELMRQNYKHVMKDHLLKKSNSANTTAAQQFGHSVVSRD